MAGLSAAILLSVVVTPAPHARAAREVPGCRPGGAGAGVTWARQRHLMTLVDSVLLGGEPALKAAMPCWHITVRGRPALMIRVASNELRAQHPRVPQLVVVALGYNSLWERGRHRYRFWSRRFDREALTLLATLRRLGARQFIWVTLRQPTAAGVPPSAIGELTQYAWYFPYVNARLRRLAALRSDVVLADWEAVSHRRGLTYDTIHLNATGAALMAKTIKRAIAHEAARQRPTRAGTEAPRDPGGCMSRSRSARSAHTNLSCSPASVGFASLGSGNPRPARLTPQAQG